ncbi:MAG: diguanylate phosphodiesterase [Aquificaceae bacterium]
MDISDGKNIKVFALLEYVIDLKEEKLYGFRAVSKLFFGDNEVSFRDITDRSLKVRVETSVLETLRSFKRSEVMFINLPVSLEIEELPLYGRNLVLNLPISMGFKNLFHYRNRAKKCGLKVALDDFTTLGYELKDTLFGSFDYVFFSDDFYTNASKANLSKAVKFIKFFGSKTCFKRIDTSKKLKLAKELDIDLGHGYLFGYDQIGVGIV